MVFDLPSGNQSTVSSGCSASISPDGSYVTVNSNSHKELLLFDRQKNRQTSSLQMIEGRTFDNQYWANNQDWIASKSDGASENIYLHHVPSSTGFQVTFSGDGDRPDYFILP